jgi:hypothetical protein
VSRDGIARSICAKLAAAAAADDRGNSRTRNRILRACQNQLRAQAGHSLTEDDRSILDILIEVRKPNEDF